MLSILLALAAVVPVILSTCFAIEIFAGLRPLPERSFGEPAGAASAVAVAVIVVPAHDEEASIAATLAVLLAEADGIAELLVVADNCTDRTAYIAREAGAKTIIRDDPRARGKGYALAYARSELTKNVPTVVLVVDADCRTDRSSIAALIAAAVNEGRPAQAVNLLRPDLDAPPFVQVSNFAFMLRNLVRQRGLQRLAKRVHLTGTGMALPWSLFAGANLGGASIVEDLDLGVSLAARGHPAMLVEDANVWSPAASGRETLQQRERWEGGFLKHALPAGVRGIARSLVRLDGRGLIGALDLCIPPLALLGMLDVFAVLIFGAVAIGGGTTRPLLTMLTVSAIVGIAVTLAWRKEGRRFVTLAALGSTPLYAARKLPMYTRMLFRGVPRHWVRTDRGN